MSYVSLETFSCSQFAHHKMQCSKQGSFQNGKNAAQA